MKHERDKRIFLLYMNRNTFTIFSILFLCLCMGMYSFAQNNNDRLVQVTGVAKMADTSDVIPYMGVFVKNKSTGTLTNENGVFSLLCYKGDTLLFNRIGFPSKEVIVPANLDQNYFSTVQYFVQDTFYLKEAIVRPYLNAAEFDYAMRYKQYDGDMYDAIKENTSKEVVKMMMRNMPNSAGENAAFMQGQQATKATYYGQQAPIGLFNPFKWAEFYKAIQRGDYRKDK